MSPPEAYSYSQSPSGADIFAYAKDNLPRVLTLPEILSAIPIDSQVPLGALVERVRITCDPNANEESVKDAIYGEGIAAGLQVIPDFDRGITVGHTDKSRRIYLDHGLVKTSPKEYVIKSTILGSGEEYEECGEVKAWANCRTNPSHSSKPIVNHCDRLECPTCYQFRLKRAAADIAARFEGVLDAIEAENIRKTGKKGKRYPPQHIGFNSSESVGNELFDKALKKVIADRTEEPNYNLLSFYFLKELRNAGHIWAEKAGILAYVMVPHFTRIKDEYKQFADDLCKLKNKDLAPHEFKYNRYTVFYESSNPLEYFKFSPHIHMITVGKHIKNFGEVCPGVFLENYSANRKKKEWGLKNKQTSKKSTMALAYYLLSHAPMVLNERGNTADMYTYGGYFSNHYLRIEKVCPSCGTSNPNSIKDPDTGKWIQNKNCSECGVPLEKYVYLTCPICGDIHIYATKDYAGDYVYPEKEKPVYRKEIVYLFSFKKGPPGSSLSLPAVRVIYEDPILD